ncbi:zinc-dependent metalloprotease [bacterium]|nr:zinc-dependent metalloprotease [bacterium]
MKFSFNLAGLITALAFLLALPGATLSAGDGKWDPMCGCWVKEEAPAPVVDEPAEEEVDAIEEATEDFKKLEGFLNLYVGEGDNEGIYYLEVPATELGHPILGAMMFSRGDGSSSLLHMPMGEMTMEWRAHADGKRLNLVRPQMDLRIDPDSELAQAFQMGTFDGVPMMVFEPVAVRHASPVEEGEGEGEGDLEAVEGEDEDVANPCSGMMSTAHQVSFTREGEEGEEELFVDPISGKWKGSMSLPDFGEMESFTMFLTLDGEDVTGTMEGDMGMEEEEIEGSFDGKTLTFGFSEAEDGFSMSMDFSFDLVKENTLKGTWTMTMSGQGMSEKMEGTAEARRKGGGAGDAGGFEDDDEEPITHYLIDISDTIWDGFGGLNIRADRDLSRIVSTKAYPENLEFDFEFSVGSRLMGVHLSLARLPEVPMTPRVSDQRVGYFTTEYLDMGVETTDGALERMANRWRLEKADPDADISAPIKPITYYVDPSVPPRWRPYVKEGIELWNKAFEAAGWIGAVRAVLPTDEDWPEDYDAGDIRYSSVSWAPSLRSTFAIGPSNVDPRTGEILNADIVFTASWIRAWTEDYELEGSPMMNLPDAYEMLASPTIAQGDRPAFLEGLSPELVQRYCALLDPIAGGDLSAHLLRSVLINDGLMLPGEEIPEEFVAQGLVEVTMHEVGHTLGLRHNFKSSSEIPWESLNDTEYTQEHGLISSVMDYASANISSDRGNQGDYYSRVVGDYDVWNIQYGYTDLSDEVEGEQHSFLAELAGRSAELGHAFGTD